MTGKNKQIREKIFEIYSKNLEIIKSHPDIKFEPDFKNAYICPICFDPFLRDDLFNNSKNQLTLEDVPPKSLGGNPKILTCKKCNSICGHELDKHLLRRLEELDSREFLPNSSYQTVYKSEYGKMNGCVKIDQKGEIVLKLEKERSNPILSEIFLKETFPPRTINNPLLKQSRATKPYQTNNIVMGLPNYSIEKRAEIALLKTSYLLAFSILGNSFLINGSLYKVREQLLNPDKAILSAPFGIKHQFPEEVLGINIIKSPKELRCFLIVFNLETKSKRRQFAIALPGFSTPEIDIYKNLDKILCDNLSEENLHFEYEHLNDLDFIKEERNVWAAYWFWRKYCEDNNNG